MNGRLRVFWMIVCMFSAPRADATSSLSYSIPPVTGPADPIEVSVQLTSDNSDIAAVGCRLTYDPAKVALTVVDKGTAAPSSWNFVFQDMADPGEVDLVLTDPTAAAATIDAPSDSEIVRMTFTRTDADCGPVMFGFNSAAPDPGPSSAAFPENQYVISVDFTINVEAASTTPTNGPQLNDRSFLRGNVANRTAHSLDLQDAVDLVSTLFGGFVPTFDCEAAFDVNDDGAQNIADVVALVQGVFGSTSFVIPDPSVTPGVVVPDGGSIPSVLGCAEGEGCP